MNTKSTDNHLDPINETIMQQRHRCRCSSSQQDVKIRRHCSFLLAILTTISLCMLVNCDNSNIAQDHYSYLDTKNSRYVLKHQDPQLFNNIRSRAERSTNDAEQNTGERENICSLCTCFQFEITCDFQSKFDLNVDFNNKFMVPTDATAIRIILAAKTRFILYQGFFLNNKVNRFIIDGFDSSQNQVEIATGAFLGNNGSNPEIKINNVDFVTLRSGSTPASYCKLIVSNCNEVFIYEDSFKDTSINAHFVGIKDLTIKERAFGEFNKNSTLRIENSNIDNLYRFDASLNEAFFINSTIGTINSGTFDVIHIKSICFEKCKISTIKTGAISAKLSSDYVSITDSIIDLIENQAIYGSGITNLLLTRNKIDKIHSNATYLVAANVNISNNIIKFLDNEWLHVQQWSSIKIADNQFGKFGRMTLEMSNGTCLFDGNSLTDPLPNSLDTTGHCTFSNLAINIPCSCNLDWLNTLSTHDYSSQTYCTIDNLSNCIDTKSYWEEVCKSNKSTHVSVDIKNYEKKIINGRFFRPEELGNQPQEEVHKITNTMIISGVVLLMGIIAVAFIIIYRLCCFHPNEAKDGDMTNVTNISNNLHEFSKENCNKMDEHFKAQSISEYPSAPSIYSEPRHEGDFHIEERPYVENCSLPRATPVMPEHIYAEPNYAEQPLLPNDYTLPVDINMEINNPYTEPHNQKVNTMLHSKPSKFPSHTTRSQHHRLPSIPPAESATTHLPDLLPQSLGRPTRNTTNPQFNNIQNIYQQNINLLKSSFYTEPLKKQQPNRNIRTLMPLPMPHLASPEGEDESELDMRGAAALPTDAGSAHSGGSDITVRVDDVIEYADA